MGIVQIQKSALAPGSTEPFGGAGSMSEHQQLNSGKRFRGTARRTTVFYAGLCVRILVGQSACAAPRLFDNCCIIEKRQPYRAVWRDDGNAVLLSTECELRRQPIVNSVQSCLHWCGVVQSPQCPYCQAQEETLAHFTTICPRFQEARTAGHNRVGAKLTSLLAKCLATQWTLFEETTMRRTGLKLQKVSRLHAW
jgi:hypothetical protein